LHRQCQRGLERVPGTQGGHSSASAATSRNVQHVAGMGEGSTPTLPPRCPLPARAPAWGSRQPLSGAAVAIACLYGSIALKLALLAATAKQHPRAAPRAAS